MFCNIPGMSQPKDAPALATEMDKLAAKLTEMGIQFEDRQIYLTRGRQIAVYEKRSQGVGCCLQPVFLRRPVRVAGGHGCHRGRQTR